VLVHAHTRHVLVHAQVLNLRQFTMTLIKERGDLAMQIQGRDVSTFHVCTTVIIYALTHVTMTMHLVMRGVNLTRCTVVSSARQPVWYTSVCMYVCVRRHVQMMPPIYGGTPRFGLEFLQEEAYDLSFNVIS
jgi:hypothetical protein